MGQGRAHLDVCIRDVRGLVGPQVADGPVAEDLRDAAGGPLLEVALQRDLKKVRGMGVWYGCVIWVCGMGREGAEAGSEPTVRA